MATTKLMLSGARLLSSLTCGAQLRSPKHTKQTKYQCHTGTSMLSSILVYGLVRCSSINVIIWSKTWAVSLHVVQKWSRSELAQTGPNWPKLAQTGLNWPMNWSNELVFGRRRLHDAPMVVQSVHRVLVDSIGDYQTGLLEGRGEGGCGGGVWGDPIQISTDRVSHEPGECALQVRF